LDLDRISLTVFLILALLARVYLRSELTQTQEQIISKKDILKSSDNEQLKQQVESLNQQIRGINNIQKQHIYWSTALAELGRLFASDIQLDLVSIDRESGKVEVTGLAGSRDSALKFWYDIQNSVYFKDINFPLSNLERATDDTFSFTFTANIENLKESPIQ
jgi:Tfp pilus assembly protein PilN